VCVGTPPVFCAEHVTPVNQGLRRCPKCDYDLRGLPARHRCPECQEPFDRNDMVLDGWTLPSLRAESIDVGGWTMLAILLLGPPFAARVLLHWSWLRSIAVLAAMAGLMIAAFLLLRARYRTQSSAMRYLVTTEGIGRYGGRVHPWRSYSHVVLMPTGHNAWRIHVYPRHWLFFGSPMINITLHCSSGDAEAMRAEIEARMLEAQRRERDGSDSNRVGR
jgi:hypothetical protein